MSRALFIRALALTFGITLLCTAQGLRAAERQPDIQHGAVIAAQGSEAGAPPCASCHAYDGSSTPGGAFPRLTSQSAYYLTKQLYDFASLTRDNAIMSPISQALTNEDLDDVAAHYAKSEAAFPPLAAADPKIVEQGRLIALQGIAAKDIQACDNCHGPEGAGLPPAIPYLAGQYAQAIVSSLGMWHNGYRKSSPGAMAYIAKELSAEETAAIAAYYQQVRASAPTFAKN
jgi:cytochrome c553